MLQQDMNASVRHGFGKGASHRLRQSGQAPAILYGKRPEPLALSLESKTLTKDLLRLHGNNVVINLNIEGEKGKITHYVLIKDIQTDPVTDAVLHVDFFEIDLDKEIVLDVPVAYTGTAKGVDLGGILNIMAQTVRIKGLPLDILDEITVDVTHLEISSSGITCGDLEIPENVSLEEDLQKLCVSVVAPKAEVEEEVEEEEGVEAEEGTEAAAGAEEPAASTEE